ncbi:N-acetylmuramoyl-L-alanine amidase, partial [Prevotella copri]|nr:N-acetylmuramoyl-L-alanine amidase [Segatella copri]MQN07531.1 N-acetylmuramoyl-L-alanine amidase [Segatella copri]MQN10937.1 N-acetylmuramoyl-L-alanine amidase [Segatella copri]MQO60487.1 N-acetylmuramoyl-L-alanine amidase [Segatella copri]MQO64359.1 N-acetylmuramoyl-L-alanine amidase [Segatella copri]
AQNQALYSLLESLCLSYPDAEILGHRDLPNVHKDCPAFDVKRWLKLVDFHI